MQVIEVLLMQLIQVLLVYYLSDFRKHGQVWLFFCVYYLYVTILYT